MIQTTPLMKNSITLFVALTHLIIFSGCQSGGQASYVDSSGKNTVVSMNRINIQDFANASDVMIDSLLTSGVLSAAPKKPAVLAMSRISNKTTSNFDIDRLTKKIRVALNRSGKAQTSTVIGLGNNAEDPLAKERAEYEKFRNNDQSNQSLPDFTLSGKILEDRTRADDIKQTTYIFQLSLTNSQGLAVWEDEKLITKQGRKNSVGW